MRVRFWKVCWSSNAGKDFRACVHTANVAMRLSNVDKVSCGVCSVEDCIIMLSVTRVLVSVFDLIPGPCYLTSWQHAYTYLCVHFPDLKPWLRSLPASLALHSWI